MEAMMVYLGKHTLTNQLLTKWFSLKHCAVSPLYVLYLYNLSFCPAASKVDVSKHGMMKFREERSILGLGLSSGSFHDRYFILNSSSLRMYKEVRVRVRDLRETHFSFPVVTFLHRLFLSLSVCQSNRPERDWQVKNLKVYLGIKKKVRPPTWWEYAVWHWCDFVSSSRLLTDKQQVAALNCESCKNNHCRNVIFAVMEKPGL